MRRDVPALIGTLFGHLTIVCEAPPKPGDGHIRVRCRCTCGRAKVVTLSHLTSGDVRSCGCLHRALSSQRLLAWHAARRI